MASLCWSPNLSEYKNSSNLKIVLIYLGDVIPEYVISNANRITKMFTYEVVLVIEGISKLPKDVQLSEEIRILEVGNSRTNLKYTLAHDWKFRDGFWFYTLERVLLLKTIHGILGSDCRILHVESDMLLFPTFPFEKILKDRIMWFSRDDSGDVGSLIYSPTLSETEWLHQQIEQHIKLNSYSTDMSALHRIRLGNSDKIETFPDLLSGISESSASDVFDGSDLGMWLLGTDPRNTFGFHILHENSTFSFHKSSSIREIIQKGKFALGDKGLGFSYEGRIELLIHSLHVHTKDIELFSSDNSGVLSKYIKLSDVRKPILFKIDRRVLLNLIKENKRNGTLISYFRHFLKFLFKKERGKSQVATTLLNAIFSRRFIG
jgi:hypothetical protein